MSNSILEKYFINEGEKINPNVRRLIFKNNEIEYFSTLSKNLLNKDFVNITTLELTELFWLSKNKPVTYCLTCGKQTKFGGWKIGYHKYCGRSCQMKDPEQIEIRKQDSIQRFNVTNYLLKPEAIKNRNNTKQTDEYRKKFKQIINKIWNDPQRKQQIVEKILKTKSNKDTSTQWKNRYSKNFQILEQSGFSIIDTNKNGKPLQVKHNQCGQIQIFGRLSNKQQYLCCVCHQNNRIKFETTFFDEISKLFNIQFERNIKINNIKVDGLYKNIGIDYNGLFWHSTAAYYAGFGEHDPNYHANRFRICKKNNIKLIQIFEDEWLNNKEIVLNRLKHIFGLGDRIFARKCEVKKITNSIARLFLIENHSSKNVPSLYSYGLFYENKLVAVITIGKTRFGNRQNFELLRFCSKGTVVGGLSRLVQFACKDLQISELFSYSDNFWGDGSGYIKAGFTFIKNVEPGYFYFDKKNFNRVSRHAVRKDQFEKVFNIPWDTKLTEEENAIKVNCYRVYDAGKYLFKFTAKLI